MDNSPLPSKRQAAKIQINMKQMSGRASIDMYILLVVLTVLMLTAMVKLISHLNGDTGLLSVVTGMFVVASLCCVVIAAWRVIMAKNLYANRRNIAMSAALGSFFSGLFTVAFADDILSNSLYIVIGIFLAIVALCVIGIIMLLKDEETTRQVELPVRRSPKETDVYSRDFGSHAQTQVATQSSREPESARVQAMNSLPPDRVPTGTPQLPGGLNILPAEVSGLSSLFERDELYNIPRNTRARLFILSKSNDILENCEDACDVSQDETLFALCDGVSTSKFARPWARLLAGEWIAQPLAAYDEQALGAWLIKPRQSWLHWINNTWFLKINDRNRSMGRVEFTRDELDTFIKQGAAATFLGLDIDKATSTWSAVAVGDTCLFHFSRSGAGTWKYDSYPLKQSGNFTDAPAYITTRPQSESLTASHLVSTGGEYKAGDLLVMATDALAKWLLTQLESGQLENIISLLTKLENSNDRAFVGFVNDQRAKKQLTDDDTTLILSTHHTYVARL